jgi:hypothetical protein
MPEAAATIAGSAPAAIQRMERGSQLQRETVVCGEPVGGELALPADHSADRGTQHRRQPDEGQHSADRPLTLLQGVDHSHDHPGDHHDGKSGPRLAARQALAAPGQHPARQTPRRGKSSRQ